MQTYTTNNIQKLGSHLFNFGLLAGLATLAVGLVSCGGSSDSAPAGVVNTTPTITSISPYGIVASSSPQNMSILGTNFVNGMILNLTNSSGVPYTITASSVTSSTVFTASAVIATAPIDNYVTVTVKASTSATASSSAVWGVASTAQTSAEVQTIFANNCTGCHSGATPTGSIALDNLSSSSSTGVIGIPSAGCSAKFRVVPGDPRRVSSVLIDKIKATTTTHACAGTPMPPPGSSQIPPLLSTTDINAIVDWVAGGAH